jgi:uncharacterized protein
MSPSVDALRAFLEHPDRPEGTFTLDEVRGFLFAVANAPHVLAPSDWIPAIVGKETFPDLDDSDPVYQALLDEFDAINAFSLAVVHTHGGALPPHCTLLDDPVANVDDDAPITGWCAGFREGHRWLFEAWNVYLPMDEDDSDAETAAMANELTLVVTALCFFASRQAAEAVTNETTAGDLTRVAAMMHRAFPLAIRDYVRLGRTLQLVTGGAEEPVRRASPKIGRNDPCPCGSGRKYKKCCGVTH